MCRFCLLLWLKASVKWEIWMGKKRKGGKCCCCCFIKLFWLILNHVCYAVTSSIFTLPLRNVLQCDNTFKPPPPLSMYSWILNTQKNVLLNPFISIKALCLIAVVFSTLTHPKIFIFMHACVWEVTTEFWWEEDLVILEEFRCWLWTDLRFLAVAILWVCKQTASS